MHKLWPVLIGNLMLSLCPFTVRAADFEGVLHMSTTHPATNSASSMDWYLKGDKARVEMSRGEGQANVMIFDAQTRMMQMAMPGQKTYMEISMAGERGQHLKEALDKQTVERTGKTDKIAGYSCEVWRITDKEHDRLKNDICVAKGFGKAATFWVDPKEMRRSSQPSWVKQLVEEGGFGLRSIHYDEAGKESSRMEVTSIDKKRLDPSLFTFPVDWAKQDMSAMQERMKVMRDQKGQGGGDFSEMAEEMKKRKASRGDPPAAAGGNAPQTDVKELMKQFGEMLKNQPPSPGGQ